MVSCDAGIGSGFSDLAFCSQQRACFTSGGMYVLVLATCCVFADYEGLFLSAALVCLTMYFKFVFLSYVTSKHYHLLHSQLFPRRVHAVLPLFVLYCNIVDGPEAPENLILIRNSTSGHIEISWEAPSSGVSPDFYVVESLPPSHNVTTDDLQATFNSTLLTEGFPYLFYVRAGTSQHGLGEATTLSQYVVPRTSSELVVSQRLFFGIIHSNPPLIKTTVANF